MNSLPTLRLFSVYVGVFSSFLLIISCKYCILTGNEDDLIFLTVTVRWPTWTRTAATWRTCLCCSSRTRSTSTRTLQSWPVWSGSSTTRSMAWWYVAAPGFSLYYLPERHISLMDITIFIQGIIFQTRITCQKVNKFYEVWSAPKVLAHR